MFMDEARRDDTLRAIEEHSKLPDQATRQIIVVTPNSLASVVVSNHVRVVKMPDPVKQTAHGLQQTTLD